MYFLIRKLKQRKPYLFPLDKWEGRTNEFCVGIVYSGKFERPQVVCTPCSKRYKSRYSRKTVCASDIQQVYRVM